jgi:hypothetical protein
VELGDVRGNVLYMGGVVEEQLANALMVLGMDVRHIKLDDVLAEIEAQSEQEPD